MAGKSGRKVKVPKSEMRSKQKKHRTGSSHIKKEDSKKKYSGLKDSFMSGIWQFFLGVITTIAVTLLFNVVNGYIHPQYEVGEIITLGEYEQDNNESNGKE